MYIYYKAYHINVNIFIQVLIVNNNYYICIIYKEFRFPLLFKKNAKVYLPVHLIPFLIYKRKAFIRK